MFSNRFKWVSASFLGLLSVGFLSMFAATTDASAQNIAPAALIASAVQPSTHVTATQSSSTYNPILANRHN